MSAAVTHDRLGQMVQFLADRLCEEFRVYFKFSKKVDGAADVDLSQAEYLQVKMRFHPKHASRDDEQAFTFAVHEHLHVLMSPLSMQHRAVTDGLPKRAAAVAHAAYTHADETVVTRLTRVLSPLLYPEFLAQHPAEEAKSDPDQDR